MGWQTFFLNLKLGDFMKFKRLGGNPKITNVNGHIKLIKGRTQKTFVDQDLAVVDMLTVNHLVLNEEMKWSSRTLRNKFIRFNDWLKVPDYIYEYPELEEVFMLERDSNDVEKQVTIDSKIVGFSFVMSDEKTLDACFVKFKNIPIWYPIQSAFNSPYVFDDDSEVVLKRNTAEFEVVKKLFQRFLPKFDFNLYIKPLYLKTPEDLDLFTQLITNLKRNSLLNRPSVRTFVKTKVVKWFTWECETPELLRKAIVMKPTTRTLFKEGNDWFMFDRHDFLLHRAEIFEKIAGRVFKNFTDEMRKAVTVNKKAMITDEELKKQGVPFMPRYDHQRRAINFLVELYKKKVAGAMVAYAPGTGKSYITSVALTLINKIKPNQKILIACPLIMVGGWKMEIEKFAPQIKDQVEIINFDKVRKVDKKKYTILVVDEAHNLNNRQGQLFRQFRDITAKFKILLSGTFIMNSFLDYVAMVEIIYPNFGRILRFSLGGKMKDKKNIAPIMKITRGIYIQQDHDAKEFDVTEYDLELNATFAERKIIENIKRIYKADNKRTTIKDNYYKNDVIVQLIRMLQAISNHDNLPDDYKVGIPPQALREPTAKVQKTVELVKKHKDEKILIFAKFKDTIKQLHQLIPDSEVLDGALKGEARTKLVNKFQNEKSPRVLIISLKAGNSAITLTRATVVIIVDSHWNRQVLAQAKARAIRSGQDKPVTVYELYVRDSIDDLIRAIHRKKDELYKTVQSNGDISADLTSSDDPTNLVDQVADYLNS
jgi:superfamily II DNA or RNA helicase